jgi:hypothetical protein
VGCDVLSFFRGRCDVLSGGCGGTNGLRCVEWAAMRRTCVGQVYNLLALCVGQELRMHASFRTLRAGILYSSDRFFFNLTFNV